MVAGPVVAPVHVAVPLVWSFKLLMLMLIGSETDQVAKPKGPGAGYILLETRDLR